MEPTKGRYDKILVVNELRFRSGKPSVAFALLNRGNVPRTLRILLFTVGIALTAAVAALAFVSFTRKVATFRTA
ncbi:MAG: hypothetical protein ABI610_06860, partial [Acidobacteriota bacterium]